MWPYVFIYIWVFPKIGVPQNGWLIMENPIKMDDLVVPLFLETPIYIYYICLYIHTYVCVSLQTRHAAALEAIVKKYEPYLECRVYAPSGTS